MRNIKHNLFQKTIALLMVGLLMFSQLIILQHYKEFHSNEETHNQEDKSDNHHSDTCFICHTQATAFILSDFNFNIKEPHSEIQDKHLFFNVLKIFKKVNYQYSGRAPPFVFHLL